MKDIEVRLKRRRKRDRVDRALATVRVAGFFMAFAAVFGGMVWIGSDAGWLAGNIKLALYLLACFLVIGAGSGMFFTTDHYYALRRQLEEDQDPPSGGAGRPPVARMSSAHRVGGVTIYENTGSGTTLVGKLELDNGTFGDLAETLQANGWCWSRDVLDESLCFSNLRQYQPSGETKYAEIRDEMDRLNVIYKDRGSWWVTPRYQRWFISKSDRLSLEQQG